MYNIDDETVPARLNTDDKKTTFQVKIKSCKIFPVIILLQICVREGKYKLIWGTKYMLGRHYRKLKNRGTEEERESRTKEEKIRREQNTIF